MLNLPSKWRKRRAEEREEIAFEAVFEDAFGRPSLETMHGWSDEQLHERLTGNDLWPAERSLAESVARVREATRAAWHVQRWFLGVAVLSLVVATVALALSIYAIAG